MAHSWKNWSGSVRTRPEHIAYPSSEAEVQQLVRQAAAQNKKIRVVGAGHSFTPVAATDQILVSLDELTGLIEVDASRHHAIAWAGTRLRALGAALAQHGLAMENLGDIDVQSIAGAMSTGTHGTGVDFGTLATQITSLTLVTADGQLLHLDPETSPDRFRAAQISLGTLGIITRIGLRCLPAYKVRYTSGEASVDHVLQHLGDYHARHRNFEFYYFPYTQKIQTKTMDLTDEPPTRRGIGTWFNDVFMENGMFWLFSRISRHFRAHRNVSKLVAWGVPKGTTVSWSHQAYATKRLVKFQEMEYNVPAEHFEAAFTEIERNIRELDIRVHFPLECRWVKGDDIWLSPAYGRDSAYIAVHMYQGMPYKAYFHLVEGIMKKYGGRPHWGKMHFLSRADLVERYPKFLEFLDLRKELDPNEMFLNGYLQTLFGEVEKDGKEVELVAEKIGAK